MSEQQTSNHVANLRSIAKTVPQGGYRMTELLAAADEIERLQRSADQLRTNIGEVIGEKTELAEALRASDQPPACEHGAHPPTNCAICTSVPPPAHLAPTLCDASEASTKIPAATHTSTRLKRQIIFVAVMVLGQLFFYWLTNTYRLFYFP